MTSTNSINSLQHLIGTVATGGSTEAKRPDSATSGSSATSNVGKLDQASLSSASTLVGQALSGSDVRTAKVSALQQAIASGSYRVPSSAIADKIVSSLLN